jgi:hypothetical protein
MSTTATREHVLLNKLPAAERGAMRERLNEFPWLLEGLEKKLGLGQPAPRRRSSQTEPCPCGCNRPFTGLTVKARAHLRSHPHPPNPSGGAIRFTTVGPLP